MVIGVATAGLATWAIGTLAGQVGAVTSVIVSGVGFNFGSAFSGTLLYGGNVKDAFRAGFKAGFIGGISAGLSQWVNTAFQNKFLPRAIGRSVVNGATNVMSGGSFKDGFRQSFVMDALNGSYKKLVGETPEAFGPPEADPNKGTWDKPTKGSNHIGIQGFDKNGNPLGGILREGGSFSKIMSTKVPFINAIAGMHDVMQVALTFHSAKFRSLMNIPYMIPATLMAVGAYMGQLPPTYHIQQMAK